jgi:hypothetical protein
MEAFLKEYLDVKVKFEPDDRSPLWFKFKIEDDAICAMFDFVWQEILNRGREIAC